MNRFLKRIVRYLHKHMDSPIGYARFLGVTIGEKSTIGDNVHWSSEPYLITIDRHVQVTNGVWFHTHGGGNAVRRTMPDFDCFGKIHVCDWVYIGAGSQIMPGVTLGEGTLVAAGSVVTKSTPSHSVVGGNPARVICSVDDYLEKNAQYNVHSKKMTAEQKKEYLLGLSDEMFIKK